MGTVQGAENLYPSRRRLSILSGIELEDSETDAPGGEEGSSPDSSLWGFPVEGAGPDRSESFKRSVWSFSHSRAVWNRWVSCLRSVMAQVLIGGECRFTAPKAQRAFQGFCGGEGASRREFGGYEV